MRRAIFAVMGLQKWWGSKSERVYARELPGGGFVAIDVTCVTPLLRGQRCSGRLVVERRTKFRPGTHPSPVIAEGTGETVEAVVQQLLPVAQNNPAIAAALIARHVASTRV